MNINDEIAQLLNRISSGRWVVVYEDSMRNHEYVAAGNPQEQLALTTFAERLAGLMFDAKHTEASNKHKMLD